jgi:hypothetical protein
VNTHKAVGIDDGLPPVYVVHDLFAFPWTVVSVDVLLHPFDEVILERPFDDLMQDIGSNKAMYISTRKVIREWLAQLSAKAMLWSNDTHDDFIVDSE